ncbi:MAG: hypothetical protein JSV96_15150 [Candidatus Aminicenantes bacterium]|nr:MAG: hypothetical protein JSV96_15150 [Candidatus Aminicenantes bacterium]
MNRKLLVLVSICIVFLLMFAACKKKWVNFQVNWTLDIQTIDCDVAIPDQVIVIAGLLKGKKILGTSWGVFASNGPFNLVIPCPKKDAPPDAWKVINVIRPDFGEICIPEETCAEDELCLDMASKPKKAPLNSPIHWRIRCKCMKK